MLLGLPKRLHRSSYIIAVIATAEKPHMTFAAAHLEKALILQLFGVTHKCLNRHADTS